MDRGIVDMGHAALDPARNGQSTFFILRDHRRRKPALEAVGVRDRLILADGRHDAGDRAECFRMVHFHVWGCSRNECRLAVEPLSSATRMKLDPVDSRLRQPHVDPSGLRFVDHRTDLVFHPCGIADFRLFRGRHEPGHESVFRLAVNNDPFG